MNAVAVTLLKLWEAGSFPMDLSSEIKVLAAISILKEVRVWWDYTGMIVPYFQRCEIPDTSGVLHNVSVGIYFAKDATSDSAAVAVAVAGVLVALVLVIAASTLIVVFGMGRLVHIE